MNRDEYRTLSRASRTGLKQAARFTANGTQWAVSRHGVTRLHQSVIRFGHGATHYRDFDVIEACHPGTRIKRKWFKADDGLRYYR